jgi:heptosyltransferase-3
VKLLFVKLKHIGDALLLTPTLVAARARYPDAAIWVVVRRGCEGILEGCPAIDRVLTSAAPEAEKRDPASWLGDLKLIRELRAQRFEWAFELSDNSRGRWVAWLSGAKTLCTDAGLRPLNVWWRGRFDHVSGQLWKKEHRAEKDFLTVHQFLPLSEEVPPLCFARECTAPWNDAPLKPPFIVFHPGTRWLRKRWPVGNWIELGRQLGGKGFQIIVSAGPDAEEVSQADEMSKVIGGNSLSTAGKLRWSQLAWLLYQARLFVGVDTAAMHLAAACQSPTVAIFGPSKVSAWGPWRVPCRVVTPGKEALADMNEENVEEQRRFLTEKIPLEEVKAACEDMVAHGRG